MVDQTQTLGILQFPEFLEVLPGITQDPKVNFEFQRQSIDATLDTFIDALKEELAEEEKIYIIFAMDGSLMSEYEFILKVMERMSEDLLNKLVPVHSAKIRKEDGKKAYELSKEIEPGYKVKLVDDIYDHGESSGMIMDAGVIDPEMMEIVALTTKVGRGYLQGNIPIYEFVDKWVASGWGMNSGKFGSDEVNSNVLKNKLLEGEYAESLRIIHDSIEIYERICANSYIIEDGQIVEGWRFNLENAKKYLQLLMENCFYKDKEQELIVEVMRRVQSAKGVEKFKHLENTAT